MGIIVLPAFAADASGGGTPRGEWNAYAYVALRPPLPTSPFAAITGGKRLTDKNGISRGNPIYPTFHTRFYYPFLTDIFVRIRNEMQMQIFQSREIFNREFCDLYGESGDFID